jgi:hypothetical protein
MKLVTKSLICGDKLGRNRGTEPEGLTNSQPPEPFFAAESSLACETDDAPWNPSLDSHCHES